MPEVELFGGLRDSAGGAKTVNVDGKSIAELLENLAKKFPAMRERIDQGIAVAIDGVVYRDDWQQPIPKGAEVVLITRIAGG
ncbi:MAG: MoaD/ThiS family protein [Woeseiaceae bacterium]